MRGSQIVVIIIIIIYLTIKEHVQYYKYFNMQVHKNLEINITKGIYCTQEEMGTTYGSGHTKVK